MIKDDYELYLSMEDLQTHNFMPIVLELAEKLIELCKEYKPDRILDAGSGWSSILFKKYYPLGYTVTVDTSEKWLEITKTYFKRFKLDLNEMWLWEEFLTTEPKQFDLILHDMGYMKIRRKTLPKMLELVADDGIIVIDNTGYKPLSRVIPLIAEPMGFEKMGDYPSFMIYKKVKQIG